MATPEERILARELHQAKVGVHYRQGIVVGYNGAVEPRTVDLEVGDSTVYGVPILDAVVGPVNTGVLAWFLDMPNGRMLVLGTVGSPTAAGGGSLLDHINDPTPHPAYDDMLDLTLLFENGLI